MKKAAYALGAVLLFLALLGAEEKPDDYDRYWPQWRGPSMTGMAPHGNPPVEWSETKNVKWKIAIPGKGHATPIVWRDQIFLLTAVDTDKQARPTENNGEQQRQRRGPPSRKTNNIHEFVVLSLNRNDGKIQWQKTVTEELPQEATHELGSWASNSPITDGEHLYAYFGSRGLYCLDMQGDLKWERDFGQMSKHMEFGEGSSPTLYEDKIFVLWDHKGDSFLYAIDKKTGKDVWKVARDEETSWATPLVVEVDGKPQIITPATKRIRSYDVATGTLIWECSGMTSNVISSPFVYDDIFFAISGFRGSALLAIRLAGAKGNITDSDAIVWKLDRDTSYAPSALLLKDKIYFLKSNNGILSCFDAKTGKEFYSRQRLEGIGNIYTSPVAAQDRFYVLGQKGLTYVVKAGENFEVLAKNQLDGTFNSSPAIVDNVMYIRSYTHLYCISE